MAISTLKGLYRLVAVFTVNRYEPTVEIAAVRCPAGIVELSNERNYISFLPDDPEKFGNFRIQYEITDMGFRFVKDNTITIFKTALNYIFVAVPIIAPDG